MENLSAKKIAAEVGCGLTTIKDHLRKYGLTKGGRGAAKHKEKLVILNTMKVPTKKRGRKWDHSAVIDILKREGLYKVTRKSPKPRED